MDDKRLKEIKKIQQEKVEELNKAMGLAPAEFSGLSNIECLKLPKSIGPDFNLDNLPDISGLRDLSLPEENKEEKAQGKSR